MNTRVPKKNKIKTHTFVVYVTIQGQHYLLWWCFATICIQWVHALCDSDFCSVCVHRNLWKIICEKWNDVLSRILKNNFYFFFEFAVADHLQNLWGQTPPSSGSSFTTPSPPDHVSASASGSSPNLHSLFNTSPLLAANAAAALSLALPPPGPPPPQAASGSRLHSPGSAQDDLYNGQNGAYPSFGSFHTVNK